MKRSLLFLIFVSLLSTSLIAQYSVSGGLWAYKNGITDVYLLNLNGISGAQISFTSLTAGAHQWYKYTKSIDDAVPVPCTQNGNTSVITNVSGECGYYVASPLGTGYVWIVDYSLYNPKFTGLSVVDDENRCEQLKLAVTSDIKPIYYYAGGIQYTLSRKYLLTFNTLDGDDEQKTFTPVAKTLVLNDNDITPDIVVNPPPLTNTTFTLVDSFATYFNIAQAIRTEEYTAVAVKAYYTAETDKVHADNEVHHAGDVLGGSAPVEFTFTAIANEPTAALYIWKIEQQDTLTNALTEKVRYTDKVLQYTFDRNGTYVVSLEVSDGQSLCVDSTNTFTVIIDNTMLKIPNAFSPGSSIGVNDELRISFTSVVSFKASVFNRWGNLLFQWNDPSKGWDGRVAGKFVPTGAYLVVVEYKDANGKNKTVSRMVNILRSSGTGQDTETPTQ